MSHSFYKIWLHAVFSTKNRLPLITSNVEKKVFNYIKTQLVENGCPVRIVNGIPDHVHLLFLQNPNKTVAEIVKQVKGSSSHWVNQNELWLNINLHGRQVTAYFPLVNPVWIKCLSISRIKKNITKNIHSRTSLINL